MKIRFKKVRGDKTWVKIVHWSGTVIAEGPKNDAFRFVEKSSRWTKALLNEYDGRGEIEFVYGSTGRLMSYVYEVM